MIEKVALCAFLLHLGLAAMKVMRVGEWLVQKNVTDVLMRRDLSRKGPGYVMATQD
jgi:hypothetical protein